MKAHVENNSKQEDQDIPPFYFPAPHVSGPDIIFFVKINGNIYPCFIQLRQVLEASDAEKALATVSSHAIQEKMEKEQKKQQKQPQQESTTGVPSDQQQPPQLQNYSPTGTYISMVITHPAEVVNFQVVRPDLKPELIPREIFLFSTHTDTRRRTRTPPADLAPLTSSFTLDATNNPSSTADTTSLSSLSLTHNQDSTSNTFYDNAANASPKESIISINNINNRSNDASSSPIELDMPVSPISTLPNECINTDSHNNIASPKEPIIPDNHNSDDANNDIQHDTEGSTSILTFSIDPTTLPIDYNLQRR
ncbi:hypothetical protein BGX29_003655, partial [Mortierella sp. GBA35]